MIHFDSKSPEAGWEPFLDWLRDHDLNPDLVRQLDIDGTEMRVEIFQTDDQGRKIVRWGETETYWRSVPIRSLPPRQFAAIT